MLDDDLDFVRGALATIEEIGRGAMEELDDVLGLLRAPERARRVPQPTLADLDRLVADARATGLGVHLEVGGPLERLPAPVSREGYGSSRRD